MEVVDSQHGFHSLRWIFNGSGQTDTFKSPISIYGKAQPQFLVPARICMACAAISFCRPNHAGSASAMEAAANSAFSVDSVTLSTSLPMIE